MFEFITRMFKTEEVEERSTWYSGLLEGGPLLTAATRFTNHGYVEACIKVISETVGLSTLRVYQRVDDGRVLLANSTLDYLLSKQPNEGQTAPVFWEGLIRDLLKNGNAYVDIKRDYRGNVSALYIIPAQDVEIRKDPWNPDLYYFYQGRTLNRNNLVHIPVNPDEFGIGKSPVTMSRENIGLSGDAMEFAKAFYRNGGGLRTYLTTEQKLGEAAHDRLEKNFKGKFSGVENAHSVPVLEQGLELKALVNSLQDSLFLESRKFEEQEIATIFRIPISKLNMLDRSTHNNIEQQQLDFLTDTIMPYLVKLEVGLTAKLFKTTEKDKYVKAEVRNLLRADMQSRSTYYKSMFNMGAMAINEIRALEELNAKDNLSGHYLNAATSLIDEDGNLTVQNNSEENQENDDTVEQETMTQEEQEQQNDE